MAVAPKLVEVNENINRVVGPATGEALSPKNGANCVLPQNTCQYGIITIGYICSAQIQEDYTYT